jgi:hypothetical protein
MRRLLPMVVLLALLSGPQPEAAPAQATPTVEQTMAEVRAYLDQYRTDMAFVIADERTTQRIMRQTPVVKGAPTSRRTEAEVYFKFVDSDETWMAIRDFTRIDDTPVTSHPDLKAALQSQGLAQVARTFKAFNSQFNIGRTLRNFNEPTIALGVLEAKRAPQFQFRRKGARTQNGATLVTVAFKDLHGPHALIYDLQLRPAAVEGELVVEQGTGRIHRTVLKVVLGNVNAELTTDYQRSATLNLMVPALFREQYEDGVDHSGSAVLDFRAQYESIVCESRYTNFRQFKTTSRIK